MKRNQMKWHTIAAAMSVLLGMTTGHADTIVQTGSYSGVPNLNAVLTFNKFNPAIGTLTRVTIEMRLSTSGGQCGVDNDGAIGGLTTIEFGTEGKLSSAMPLINSSYQLILQDVQAVTSGSYTLSADNGDGPSNYDPNPPDWAQHTGSSDTETRSDDIDAAFFGAYSGTNTYTITAGIKTYYDFTGIGGADVLSSPPTTNGYVKIIYEYDPFITDIGVTKSVISNTHYYGDLFSFEVQATNNGPDNATGVQIQDNLPAGLTLMSYSATEGSYSGGIWTIGSMTNGESQTLTINVRVDATGTFNNTASLYAVVQQDDNPGNNSDSETVTVPAQADLSLSKGVSNPTPNVGSQITYTLTLNNSGPDAATNVTVDDDMPEGLTYQSHSASRGTYNNAAGTWTITNMPVGTATLSIVMGVAASGYRQNTAQVTASTQRDPDSTPGNLPTPEDDDDDAEITVPPAADLRLSKTATALTPPNVDKGENVRFDIIVTNDGPDAAHNVTVQDVLDAGFLFVSATPSGDYNEGTGTWTVGTLNNGASATLQIVATANVTGDIPNKARVMTSDEYDRDSTPGNDVPSEDDQDDVVVSVPRIVDLKLSKVVQSAPSPLNLGGNVTFRVTVTNEGPDNASGVHVWDLLPSGDFTYVSNSPSKGVYNSGTGDWNVGSLANGASAFLDVTATVLKTTIVTNTAEVSACPDHDIDSTPDNLPTHEDDDASVTVDAEPAADLRLLKTADAESIHHEENVTYTITLVNDGPDAAHNVTVQDVLDTGFLFVSATPSGDYNEGTGAWTVGTLNNGASATLQIVATANVTGNIPNKARVMTSDEYDRDSTPGNDVPSEDDQDDVTVTVDPVADLRLTKTVDDATPDVQDTLTYTITLTNEGPDSATDIEVEDILSGRLTYISHSGGDYTPSTGIWDAGDLADGESTVLEIIARTDSGGVTDNIAQVHAVVEHDPDSEPDNDNPEEDDQGHVIVTSTAASIGDYVWQDIDRDKLKGSGETGISGVTLNLSCEGMPCGTATTDTTGRYIFQNLRSGDYRVEVDDNTIPGNYALTTENLPYDVSLNPGQIHLSADFGYKAGEGQIGELVWLDINANGVRETQEPGLENIMLFRKNKQGSILKTCRTNESGWYAFTKLLPDTYCIEVKESTLPPNAELTTGVRQYTVILDLDEHYRLANFGYRFSNSSIGDYVWNDRDTGKDQDPGESGLEGVVVRLEQNGSIVGERTTGTNGAYLFEGLPAGEYTVTVDGSTVPDGFAMTTDDDSFTVTLNGLNSFVDADFGFCSTAGSIGDLVWEDADGEGDQDPDETGISAAIVHLIRDDTVVASDTTDENGLYLFSDIPPGEYSVDVDESSLQPGYELTTANDPHAVSLQFYEQHMASDFGYRSTRGTIGDFVWFDEDGEGDQDAGETGLSGVIVHLIHDGAIIAADTTDGFGSYLFRDVLPGQYTVDIIESSLPGYRLTTANEPDPVSLGSRENHLDSDFGYKVVFGTIGDFVWNDGNRNGVQDPGEEGIPNLSVVLLNGQGRIIATDTTDASGMYLFDRLIQGEYFVDVWSTDPDMPELFFSTTDNEPLAVTLTEGADHLLADFGYARLMDGLGAIGDYTWHDADWDRNQDPGEEQLSRIVVSIYLNGQLYGSKATDSFGFYHFSNLPPGEYEVIVDVIGPAPVSAGSGGWQWDAQPAPELQSGSPEWTITTIDSFHVSLAEGQIFTNADFGFAYPEEAVPGRIGDFIWLDADEDGNQDPGETGIPGISVRLISNGTIVRTALTDGQGLYLFDEVFPGDYTVDVDEPSMPAEYMLTSDRETYDLFVAGGGELLDADFGYQKVRPWGGGRRYVLARYQSWYGDARNDSPLRHWDASNLGGYSDTTLAGEYDTAQNPALWEYHILSAWASGIDGFVVDWYGKSSFENDGLIGLLQKAEDLNLLFADFNFRFEIAASYNETSADSLGENMMYVADSIMTREAYWGNFEGLRRPLFFYDTEADLLNASDVHVLVDSLLPSDAFALWNGFDTRLFDPADVCYSWVQPLEKSWDPEGKVWGETHLYTSYQRVNSALAEHKLLFALGTVWPGFDDRLWSLGSDRWIDRQDSTVYQATWDMVHDYDLPLSMPWCLVETWNDWNSGTGIEPTVTHGYTFSRVTRENAVRFKGGLSGPVGVDDFGLMVPRHIYLARLLAAKQPDDGRIETLIGVAVQEFMERDFPSALSYADLAAGVSPPPVSVSSKTDTSITLFWEAAAEATGYTLYTAADSTALSRMEFSSIRRIDVGNVTTTTLSGLMPGTVCYIAIAVQHLEAGIPCFEGWIMSTATGTGIIGIETETSTAVGESRVLPTQFTLSQNYPNPFNPATTLLVELPVDHQVILQIFDLRGKRITTLLNTVMKAGYHRVEWDGRDQTGQYVPSGVYVVQCVAGEQVFTRKMMLVK